MSEEQNQLNEAFDNAMKAASEIGKQHTEILNKVMGSLGPIAPVAGNVLSGATDLIKNITDMANQAVDSVSSSITQSQSQGDQ